MNTTAKKVTVSQQYYGLIDNNEVYAFILKNSMVEIGITNLGCIILSVNTPDKNGDTKNIVAGFKTIPEYKNNKDFFGCVVGRYANRISNGCFKIGEKTYQLQLNDGNNNLHGGTVGFDKKVWNLQRIISNENEAGVELSYLSKDGEEGFPGNLEVSVTYLLNHRNELTIHYKATTDKATPVSLTNHSYFNLTGFENNSVLNHSLTIYSNEYTEKNEHNQPTGKFINVANTVFDFRSAKRLGTAINDAVLKNDRGYDHNFVLKHHHSEELVHAATLSDNETGRKMDVYTTAPGIQVYTANFWDGSVNGSQNVIYKKHSAIALETQLFPDSPNHAHFPTAILHPGEEYNSTTIYTFGFTHS
ncbi:galactose mutarotase [Ilyomonas limi]|uniref:Aldose 1-epimerase n=1 Tax=Ilyomonas limi TaxID=2575867 RepID=A0A4U3KQT3_9BACT|nr:aldose epimerase family protein [Ilyomonas limi]TKK64541.1 galactose mutarotase [Ilyomonas limi]